MSDTVLEPLFYLVYMNIVVVSNRFRDLLVYGLWRIFDTNFEQLKKYFSKNPVLMVIESLA